jgi:RHS repeat-associated protein
MLDLGQRFLRSRRHLRSALIATTILTSGLVETAWAQNAGSLAPPPVRRAIDENGVDVLRGTISASQTGVTIGGGGQHGLAYSREINSMAWRDSFAATLNASGGSAAVTINGVSDTFTLSGSTYVSTEGNGATLVNASGIYTYTNRDGVVARFEDNSGYFYSFYQSSLGRVSDITYPDGTKVNYTYKVGVRCGPGWENGTCPTAVKNVARLQSVTNSNGYQLKFSYAYNDAEIDVANYSSWATVASVKAINNGVEYCDPSADSCALTGNWPGATYGKAVAGSITTYTATDAANRTTTYTVDSVGGLKGMKRPGASSDNVIITYGANGVASVARNGVTNAYSYADSGTTRSTTVTNPLGGTQVYVGDTTTYLISSFRDELNRTTAYTYDSKGRVLSVTYPEGNKVQYTYDARGNVTETRAISKTPGTPPDIVTSATFASSCTNPKVCNKPITTSDAKGNVTDYAYDATHGSVLTVTAPAAVSGDIRPQTRLTYGTAQAYYKNSSGSVVASGVNRYALTASSTCQTTASCSGTADEVKTIVGYGPQVAGTPNNLLPVTSSKGSGNGVLTATTAATYDNIGNAVSIDGPLAGTADTTVVQYDAVRQVMGVIGPDPDGAGVLKNRAQRMTYNLDGQVTVTEVGTTVGQTPAAFAAFVPLQQTIATYDANARKTSDTLQVGTTKYALTQFSYDAKGRLDCAAVRMNIAVYGSLPAACTASTLNASNGPDRITKTIYDAADQVTKVQTAVGTADQSDEVTSTYNLNGTTATVADANGNLTTMIYDGFDRVSQTRFPTAGNGAVSSSTDYEGASYDANGNVAQRRLRDGNIIGYTFDNLNRVITKDVPATGAYFEQDIAYQYDLLGRPTRATGDGWAVNAYVYDALGRMTTEQTYNTAMYHAYDLAGRETRRTWAADGNYVDYNRLVTGEVQYIRENGAQSGLGQLGSYTYNDLGQLTNLTRGNGTVTAYNFDPVSRLSQLTHDLGGTTHDVTTAFTYNPASQIASSTRNNDIYKWNGHYNIDRPYTVNGLNQLTTAGAVALGYDGRGNLTSSGSSIYRYTAENRLSNLTSSSISIGYEPGGGQMLQLYSSGTGSDTRFAWSGGHMTMEIDAAAGWPISRRYVYGPGADSPLVWYEGTGLTDRRWLIPDERGSIVAVTNASGAVMQVNSYDEYGIPAATNLGRFQYTGQAWLPELGMYYYKARIYSPTLGRFMQTDPIGYGAGMNMYNYVGSDPVNFSDPLGLRSAEIKTYALPVEGSDIVVTGQRKPEPPDVSSIAAQLNLDAILDRISFGGISAGVSDGGEIVVTARKSKPQNRFRIARFAPPNSKQCFAGGRGFRAPNDFNPPAIVRAGSASGLSGAKANVGHYGTYDFQRQGGPSNTTFYSQYTAVSNLAVGLYLAGAGYSRGAANTISDSFATAFSSNGATSEQNVFRNLAFDITEGKANITCYK